MQFSELRAELESDLLTSSTGTFYSTAKLNTALNRANRWACSRYPWPYTEEAKYATSVAAQEYYDYPAAWQSDSISRLSVKPSGGAEVSYRKVAFQEFERYRLANPSGTDKIFSDHGRFYFIWPVVQDSTSTVYIWGQAITATLSADADKSPLSYGEQQLEEAIIKYAKSLMLERRDVGPSNQSSKLVADAEATLLACWNRIRARQQQYRQMTRPLFERINVVPVRTLSPGRFPEIDDAHQI